jgi:AcrR family transcriptional regulator
MQRDVVEEYVGGSPVPFELRHVERRDAAEHRRQILAAARDLFAQRGLEAVSMHQIARGAGVGQGTLYRRYTNKGELCLDLLHESIERLCDDIEGYVREYASSPPLERLDGVIRRLADFSEAHAPYLSAAEEAFCGSRRALQFSNWFYRRLHATVAGLLAESEGHGDPNLITVMADAVLAALSPDLYLFQRHERGFTQAQILDGLRRIYTR